MEVFEDSLSADLEKREVPIIYKKETPNKKSAIETGKNLLKVFYENIDMTGFEIVAIELPLMARLYTDEKQPTELILTGIIDLLLKDAKGPLQEIVAQLAGQCLCLMVGKSGDKFLGTSYRYIEKYAGQIKMTPHKACIKVISDTEKVLQLILGVSETNVNAETSEMATV